MQLGAEGDSTCVHVAHVCFYVCCTDSAGVCEVVSDISGLLKVVGCISRCELLYVVYLYSGCGGYCALCLTWNAWNCKCFCIGDIVITLLIDLKKAFDTIDDQILLRKLYGIRGSMLKWIENYFTDRLQYVVFDSKVSETHGVKCGVPQGSIIRPLICIISVNDICNVSPMLFKILYADDTCVLISGNHLNDLIDRQIQSLFF